MRRRDIKQLLLGTEKMGGARQMLQAWHPGQTRSSSHRRDNEADAQTDCLRRYAGAESPIRVGQTIYIRGERVTPEVAGTDVRPAGMLLHLAGFCWTSRQNSWFQACVYLLFFWNTGINWHLAGITWNFPLFQVRQTVDLLSCITL